MEQLLNYQKIMVLYQIIKDLFTKQSMAQWIIISIIFLYFHMVSNKKKDLFS